jgi:predicted TIM-barrel fold metal-dependent hydrolase
MREIRTLDAIGAQSSTLEPDPVRRNADLTIISVDDHLIEPPDLFEGRMPSKFRDRSPYVREEDGGDQVWVIDGVLDRQLGLSAVAGRPKNEWTRDATRFNDMRPGCWRIEDRVRDMDLNGVAASLCFPSSLMGFCGSRMLRVDDEELALAMMRAFNDWHHDVWWASAPDRIIPLQIPWLRDPEIAAQEIRLNAARGFRSVSFCEDPARLGLPSIWTRYWDPIFKACEETETVVSLHVGSSGWNPSPSAEAPAAMRAVHFAAISLVSATEWLWSGVPTRFPNLKIVMSEGGVGWVPVLANRSDYVIEHSVSGSDRAMWTDDLLPSEILKRNFWFCLLDEPLGPELAADVGVDRILSETDYPHADGTWPNSQEVIGARLSWMSSDDVDRITYRNAEDLFGFKVKKSDAFLS